MSVTPLTSTGIAIFKLKRMLSKSSTFQAAVGVTTEAAALPFIHVPRKRSARNDQADKPFAVISLPMQGFADPQLVAGGGANWFCMAGSLELTFIFDVGDHPEEEDELFALLNVVEGIYIDLLDLAGVDDHLSIVAAPAEFGPAKSHDKKVAGDKAQRPFWKVMYPIRWK